MQIETVQEIFRFDTCAFQLKRVKNLDALVDQVDDAAFAEDERLPYWAELWPSAIALSRFVLSHSGRFRNKSVLELGCGLGLTSLALTQARPARLLITDYEQDALDLSVENFLLNELTPPETAILDWREPQLTERFDVIVASDILYEERFFRPVIQLLNQLLKTDGTFILAEPGRPVAQSFFELFRQSDYGWKSTGETVSQSGKDIQVRIYECRRITK